MFYPLCIIKDFCFTKFQFFSIINPSCKLFIFRKNTFTCDHLFTKWIVVWCTIRLCINASKVKSLWTCEGNVFCLILVCEIIKEMNVSPCLSFNTKVKGFDIWYLFLFLFFFLPEGILEGHKHGVNSQMSKYKSSKSFKIMGEWHWCTNKISIDVAHIPHAHVHEFLECERGDLYPLVECNIHKNVYAQNAIKTQQLNTIVGIFGRCHIPCLCYILLYVCCGWHQHDRLLNWMNVGMV